MFDDIRFVPEVWYLADEFTAIFASYLLSFFSVVEGRRLRISKENHIQKALTITINTPVASSQTFSSECHLLWACVFLGVNRWVAYEFCTVLKRFVSGIYNLLSHLNVAILASSGCAGFSSRSPTDVPVLGDLLKILWQYPQIGHYHFHLYSAIHHPSIWCVTPFIRLCEFLIGESMYMQRLAINTGCQTLRVLYTCRSVREETGWRVEASPRQWERMTRTLSHKPSFLYLCTYTQLNATP